MIIQQNKYMHRRSTIRNLYIHREKETIWVNFTQRYTKDIVMYAWGKINNANNITNI